MTGNGRHTTYGDDWGMVSDIVSITLLGLLLGCGFGTQAAL